jgi:hypothetical protein
LIGAFARGLRTDLLTSVGVPLSIFGVIGISKVPVGVVFWDLLDAASAGANGNMAPHSKAKEAATPTKLRLIRHLFLPPAKVEIWSRMSTSGR